MFISRGRRIDKITNNYIYLHEVKESIGRKTVVTDLVNIKC